MDLDSRITACLNALAAARKPPSPRTEERLGRIQALRQRAAAVDETIDYVYFGEGGPTQGMSREDMLAGVVVPERVADGVDRVSVSAWRGRPLYHLARELRPATLLELGTGYGVSGLYWLSAMLDNGAGHLHSLDGSAPNQQVAASLWEQLAPGRWTLHNGALQRVLGDVLARIPPPDLVFLDADHSYEGTKEYFAHLLPATEPGAVLLFDDVKWSEDMTRAWNEIAAHPGLHWTRESFGMGIAVRGAGA